MYIFFKPYVVTLSEFLNMIRAKTPMVTQNVLLFEG